MKVTFVDCDRLTPYLLPPSLQDWLPEGHLARFVVDIVERLDLKSLEHSYSGRGSHPYSPAMLTALLFYGYATGVFSSRKLEQSTYNSIAFRYVAANTHPDHDTIADFRRRFLPQLGKIFVQILEIAHQIGVLKLGSVSLDGTKVKANASKHSALSYEHASKLEEQLMAEVSELLKKAESADQTAIPDGINIPEELARREERLTAITEAKTEIERRAKERHVVEQEAYETKRAKRSKKEKSKGSPPKPPEPGPTGKDQVNLTDKESRIMPQGSGFEQAYNAQAAVDTASMLVIAGHVTQNTNDKKELKPAVDSREALPGNLGSVDTLLADSGYFSEANIDICEENKITPYIAPGREGHNQSLTERFSEPLPIPDDADAVTRLKHRLKTVAGKAVYAARWSLYSALSNLSSDSGAFSSADLSWYKANGPWR